MSDLISRKAAIEEISALASITGGTMTEFEARAIIIGLPSADTDLSDYSDRLWKNAYERGKAEGARIPSAEPDFSCDGCQTPKHICGICMRNYPNITDHYCTGEAWREAKDE